MQLLIWPMRRSEVKPKEERDPLFRLLLAEKLARDDDASNEASSTKQIAGRPKNEKESK